MCVKTNRLRENNRVQKTICVYTYSYIFVHKYSRIHKDRLIDQWNRKGSPEITLCVCGGIQLVFDPGAS